jgi:hypothetical protein
MHITSPALPFNGLADSVSVGGTPPSLHTVEKSLLNQKLWPLHQMDRIYPACRPSSRAKWIKKRHLCPFSDLKGAAFRSGPTSAGQERPSALLAEPAISGSGSTESGAHTGSSVTGGPDLAEIVLVWPELPEHIKMAVVALIASE